MKKLIPLILLLFCLQTAYGQKIRFTDTSNKWMYEGGSFGNGYYPSYWDEYFSGDTNINGIVYQKKLSKDRRYGSVNSKGYFRDDTTVNKVFRFASPTEYIVYDYNLKIGDTFTHTFGPDTLIVLQIDSVAISGIWYKVWKCQSLIGMLTSYIVIEGIGEFGRLYFENGSNLDCFKNRGLDITIPSPSGGYYVSPATCALSVNNIASKSTTATISPNPANEYSKIVFPYTIQSGSLYITNILGQVVNQLSIVNSEQVYIGNGISAEGVYFYKVTDNQTGNNFTGRFVYQ